MTDHSPDLAVAQISAIDAPLPLMRKTPLVPAIVAVILAVTAFLWFTLRAVERDQADVAHGRLVLAQSAELASQVESYAGAIDGVAGSLAQVDGSVLDGTGADSATARFGRVLARNDLIIGESAVSEVGLLRVDEDRTLTVLGLFGAADPAAFTETMIDGDGPLGALIFEAVAERTTVAAPSDSLGRLFEDERAGVVLVSPVVNDNDSVPGVVVARLLVSTVLADMQELSGEALVALELFLGEERIGRTPAHLDSQVPFGEPISFETDGATWAIAATNGGRTVSHRSSWIALVAGLSLAVLGGSLANTVRRNAVTLGRLQRIEHDARHDDLTGLLNRTGLTDELNARLADRRTNNLVGVLLLDLDRLKVVNDSIGHSAGDEVLNAVADRLRIAVRDEDTVGRFGGDEFVVVSSGVPAIKDLTSLAERILEALKEPAILSDESSQMISASIGIAYVSNGDADAESLLRDSDVAMYKAKDAGGSRYVVFDAQLREQAVARLEVERELRRAIRTGQLVVHYQPIVDTETGGVDRLEALVRWQHPVRGMIPPGAFLSVAAESGLIVDVGEHVLREACRQAALWSSAVGHPIMVSVNVAERQLIDSGLLELVKRVLAETGIAPEQLELELTEELIVERLDARLTILRDLVDLGVKLAIDDFGTSRASLSQLKRLDMVSTLKIDRAFVIDVANDIVDRKIITAIVALADSMGMETIAEGVEEADQVSVLRSLGISRIQGFYFQRPAPSEQMVKVLTKPFVVPAAAGELV